MGGGIIAADARAGYGTAEAEPPRNPIETPALNMNDAALESCVEMVRPTLLKTPTVGVTKNAAPPVRSIRDLESPIASAFASSFSARVSTIAPVAIRR